MTFELKDQGQRYWQIVKRYNAHRGVALMHKVAMNDMLALMTTTSSQVIRNRAQMWVARNQQKSPGNGGGKGGPPRSA